MASVLVRLVGTKVRPCLVRCTQSRHGATDAFLRHRFGCSKADALRAEEKLLPSTAASLDNQGEAVLASRCNALKTRLGLSDEQMKKVVLTLPQVLSCSYEGNMAT